MLLSLLFVFCIGSGVYGDAITSKADPSLLLTASSLSHGASISWAAFDDAHVETQNWGYDKTTGSIYLLSAPQFAIGISSDSLMLQDTGLVVTERWVQAPRGRRSFYFMLRDTRVISAVDNLLHKRDYSGNQQLQWTAISQYVVVGSGPAGAIIAKRLTDSDYRAEVVLLEAGIRRDDNPIFWSTSTVGQVQTDTNFNFGFYSQTVPGLNNRQLQVEVGRMWGGTSMHNGMLWTRALPYDYDVWAQYGGSTWNYTNNLALMHGLENYTSVSNSSANCHGQSGEVDIAPQFVPSPALIDPLINSFRAYYTGLPEISEENCFEQYGITRNLQLSMQNLGSGVFRRESASTACLNPNIVDSTTGKGVGSRKLTVLSNAFATRLIYHPVIGTKVIGVEYVYNGQDVRVYASKEVIVSAGTYNSAALLLRSGIGNCSDITQKGVGCRFNNPYVGQNFVEHAYVSLAVRLPASAAQYLIPIASVQNTLARFFEGSLKSSVAFNYTDPTVSTTVQPDTKISWSFGGAFDSTTSTMFNMTQQFPQTPYALTNVIANLMRPKCRGQVTIADGNPSSYPVIYPNHACPDDMPYYRQMYKDLAAIVTNMTGYQLAFPPAYVIADPTLLDQIIRSVVVNSHHPAGTLRMGNFDSIQKGVVSGRLCVHGIQHLRVADASIMPTPSSLNFQAAVYSIGAKAVEFIKQGLTCN